ncbi:MULTISPECIES: preprotein translocase subunit YajC [Corallincola]|uniref:Sec translocon accessory complex subunit YajC n=3 Tax=Corallincola TaxID=1775176 RepID=A0A368NEY4_9GAMM|nr:MULTISPECIES: preprotein translocase subunit YajC [Corallincola]RCU48776.1 preprotein translocase subunit YajC [Corallincola holothuriorum]TAA42673.1 preprotein translocase subunit YajC [Corallincola spongiicola]TCI01676.1 preprotein translocase subunit YajC [Corallincola luteus]
MFIANAYAAPGAQPQAGGWDMIIMLVIFAAIFYFMIYRPQAKRVKEHKNLMSALGKGDEVLTQGGIVGKVAKVSDEKEFIVISLADNMDVTVQKSAVSAILPKGTLKSL